MLEDLQDVVGLVALGRQTLLNSPLLDYVEHRVHFLVLLDYELVRRKGLNRHLQS